MPNISSKFRDPLFITFSLHLVEKVSFLGLDFLKEDFDEWTHFEVPKIALLAVGPCYEHNSKTNDSRNSRLVVLYVDAT